MSNPNENKNPQQASNYIEINENGELVVAEPQLVESLQELSPEELEDIAGGLKDVTINVNCGKAC